MRSPSARNLRGPPQRCTVANANGVVGNETVTNVAISCANTYSVGGTVSGLVGSGLVLQNNAGDDATVAANGAFSFQTLISWGAAYAVTVKAGPSQPVQTCSVASASGTLSNSAVANVTVTCQTDRFAYVTNSSREHDFHLHDQFGQWRADSRGELTVRPGGGPSAMAIRPIESIRVCRQLQRQHDQHAPAVDPVTGALTLVGTEGQARFPQRLRWIR